MEWDQIADRWAAMARRLRSGRAPAVAEGAAPGVRGGPDLPGGFAAAGRKLRQRAADPLVDPSAKPSPHGPDRPRSQPTEQ